MQARWEQMVLALLDDLEEQAEGLALLERDLEVADRSRAEYAGVTLASRLHAAAGRDVRLVLLGGLALSGQVRRTGPDWLLLVDGPGSEWIVPHRAIGVLRGARAGAVAEDALGVLRRLTIRSVLRGAAESGSDCVLHLLDASRHEARLLRVGADFVEVRLGGVTAAEEYDVLPLAALAAVQRRS